MGSWIQILSLQNKDVQKKGEGVILHVFSSF